MKRILVITVLAVLLLSTVGASIATAKDNQPAGKSQVYQYTITTQPSGKGKLVLNMKAGTFTFAGTGYAPGTYYLYYMKDGARVDLVADGVAAAADGTLRMAGTFAKAEFEQVKLAIVSATSPKVQTTLTLTANPTTVHVGVGDGGVLVLTTTLTPAVSEATVHVMASINGRPHSLLYDAPLNSDGTFMLNIYAGPNMLGTTWTLYAVYDGDATHLSATTNTVSVTFVP